MVNRSIDVTSMNSLGQSLLSANKSNLRSINQELSSNSNFKKKTIEN